MSNRLLRCLWCLGSGWRNPPKAGVQRRCCPQCSGEGEVGEDHPWAAYEVIIDLRPGKVRAK